MEYFNLFEQYRKLNGKDKEGISTGSAVLVGIIILVCCAIIYAVVLARNISLNRQKSMLEEIQNNEEFQNQYNAVLQINAASENIDKETNYLKLLEEYEIKKSVGNYALISKIEEDIEAEITNINISGTEVTVEGNADTIQQVENSLINLRNEESFSSAVCTVLEAVNEDGVAAGDEPAETEPETVAEMVTVAEPGAADEEANAEAGETVTEAGESVIESGEEIQEETIPADIVSDTGEEKPLRYSISFYLTDGAVINEEE